MKFTSTLSSHLVPQIMAPKVFHLDTGLRPPHLNMGGSAFAPEAHTPPIFSYFYITGLSYAQVVKSMPRDFRLRYLANNQQVPAPTMLITSHNQAPSSPNNNKSPTNGHNSRGFSWPNKATSPTPRANNSCWRRGRRYQQDQTYQWHNQRNARVHEPQPQQPPPVVSYNWRMPSPSKSQQECRPVRSPAERVPTLPVSPKRIETKMEAPDHKTEKAALCESYHFRLRCLSESSQASEDSVVTFDRHSGSYESEISSDEYEESEDDSDKTLSEDEGCTTTPANSSGSDTEDSGSEDEADGPFIQVGNSEKVHLPLEMELPPPQRMRSFSDLSQTSDYEDSDDDFIVFSKDSDEAEEEEETSEDEEVTDAAQVTPVHRRRRPERARPADLKVRFSDNDEICPLWDDQDFQDARVGEWEQVARDRTRFKARIANCGAVIAPILSPEHRLKMQEKLKKFQENHSRDSQVKSQAAEKKVTTTSNVERRPVCVR